MSERVDVLTPDGHPTGISILKSEAHRTGAWHLAAHVWVLTPDDRVLIQKRSMTKDNWPGWWDVSVAGHVSAGETSLATAIREAHEELGLALREEDLRFLKRVRESVTLNGGAYIDNEFHDVYTVRKQIDISALRLDPAEVEAVALVTFDELARYELVPHLVLPSPHTS